MADWDCIVIGAGIIGSWAAYHLSSVGRRTLLIDQFMIPHTRGSSGGQSRIIRKAYTKACYAEMMSEAYSWWEKLERDSGLQLYRKTGVLIIQHQDERGALEESQTSMDQYNLPYKLLMGDELAAKYPSIRGISDCRGLLDTDAGLLLPSRCLIAIQDEFKKKGGIIHDGEKVEDIIPGTPVTVITSKRRYKANKVVVAAGPWSKDILAKTGVDLPVKTMPGLVCYFHSHSPHIHSDVQRFPVVIEYSYSPGGAYRLVYIIPITEYPGLVKTMPGLCVFFKEKTPLRDTFGVDSGFPIIYTYLYYRPAEYRFVCAFPSLEYPGMVKLVTRGEPPAYYCHPDERDTRGSQDLVNILIEYVKKHLPGLDPTPMIMEPCVYSMTPDRDYIIDYHPRCKNILIAAGFSGHGYMRAPIIGLLVSQLIRHIPISYDLQPFRLDRFKWSSVKSNL